MYFKTATVMAVAIILTGAVAARSSPGGNSTSCYGACAAELEIVFRTSFADGQDSTYFDAASCITQCEQEKFSLYPKQAPDYSEERRGGFRSFLSADTKLLRDLFTEGKESTDPGAHVLRVLRIIRELEPYVKALQATTHHKVATGCYQVCEPVIEAFMFMDKHGRDYHQELLYDTAKFCITHCEEKGSQWIEEPVAAAKKSLAEMKEAELEKQIAGYEDDTSRRIAQTLLKWHFAMNDREEAALQEKVAEPHAANNKNHGPQYGNNGDEGDLPNRLTDDVFEKWDETIKLVIGAQGMVGVDREL
ncbi:hypothetical protein LTR56_027024 [Elasticomyces elasticus]|nr:hypothetical protein LTR56_027024 [Elasticomyces elasticus]KAK3623598.1 hypothetical protein LTR22_024326 [Elasticomyces elasticus]KAK4917977.1 hypothetical protein LTR49_014252 [Elasticomyces elasticus]KAK5743923.1 hypothetical protein LTS12_023650 [Elasticomyces elasticus]